MRLMFRTVAIVMLVVFVGPALFVSLLSPTLEPPSDVLVHLYVHEHDELLRLPLEEYVAGVVAAEMPASFQLEALKTQAVAARTYALRRLKQYGGPGCPAHPAADLCSDPTTDQAWLSHEQLRDRWGPIAYAWNRIRISQAVRDTQGQVLTYGDGLIDAVYHSTSGGRTEAAEAVWGSALPYLQSVASEFEDHAPQYTSRRSLGLNELALLLAIPPADLRRQVRQGDEPVEILEHSDAGRVLLVSVAGHVVDGRTLRQQLELPSTWFEVETDGGQVHFELRGFGHGVGLSQYGADGMARQGYDYRSILRHYYPGVQIQRLVPDA